MYGSKQRAREFTGKHEAIIHRVSGGKYRARCECTYLSREYDIPSDAIRVGTKHAEDKNKGAEG